MESGLSFAGQTSGPGWYVTWVWSVCTHLWLQGEAGGVAVQGQVFTDRSARREPQRLKALVLGPH